MQQMTAISNFATLEHTIKLAFLHCVFQLIASAEGNIDEDRDHEDISLALKTVGNLSIYNWDAALRLNPHDCFYHIGNLTNELKSEFKQIIYEIAQHGTKPNLRKICADSLFELCSIP